MLNRIPIGKRMAALAEQAAAAATSLRRQSEALRESVGFFQVA